MKGWEIAWPADGALLVWAEITLAWMAVHYLLPESCPALPGRKGRWRDREPAGRPGVSGWIRVPLGWATLRAVLLTLLAGWLTGPEEVAHVLLMLVLFVTAILLPYARPWFASRRWVPEWEIGVTLAALGLSAVLLAPGGPEQPFRALFRAGASDAELAALLVLLAAAIFLGRGGTFIVKGYLDKAGTLPEFRDHPKDRPVQWSAEVRYEHGNDAWRLTGTHEPMAPVTAGAAEAGRTVDVKEMGRGRIIGNLERLLLLLLALLGSYAAVGFLIAAKGLVRAKEFEKRNYAEYFLVGTLASTALALIVGTLIRVGFAGVWEMSGSRP